MKEFEDINVLELLPQKPPFVMIDSLLSFSEKVTETSFTIRRDNIFLSQEEMDEEGLVENVAQTCAARMGYINKYQKSDSVKLGFIGAIKDMEILRKPRLGETLLTKIEVVTEVFAVTLVNACVTVANEVIATGQMKISITDIDKTE